MSAPAKLAAFVALAVATHVATVATLPWLINSYVLHRAAQLAGGTNRALPVARADATARTVVRPSPDLLYTVCVFDVSARPLRITAPVQDTYVSVAGFAADTSNFFAINDAHVAPGPDGARTFDLVLARDGAGPLPAGARVITAPSDRGLILFRSLIGHEEDLPRLREQFQLRQRCDPIE